MKFVIIGLGQFGHTLATQLSNDGYEVSVMDMNNDLIEGIKDDVAVAQAGDASDMRVLRLLDLVGDDIYVVVAIGEGFEKSILIVAQLKELGVKHIYVRTVNDLHARVLKLMGVRELFRVEDVAAKQLATRFTHDGIMHIRKIDKTHSLAEVPLPKAWIGQCLKEVGLRSRFNLNLLTLRRGTLATGEGADDADVLAQSEQPVIDTPYPDLIFQQDDVLVLFGKESDLSIFAKQTER